MHAMDTTGVPPSNIGRLSRRFWALGFAGILLGGCGTQSHVAPGQTPKSPAPKPAPVQVSAHLAPWQLRAPISRPVVLAKDGELLIMGGLDASSNSAAGIFSLSTSTGHLSDVGTLAVPTHDAAGAVLGGQAYVFGGGSNTVYDGVEAWSGSGPAHIVGRLPKPRADLSAAVSGKVAYVVGGYSGTAMDASVLSSDNGRTFKVVSHLAQPVRYAAAAVRGGTLYVIGGEVAGNPVDTIQAVNLATGKTTVTARMPMALSHAQAVVVSGRLLVLGGRVGGVASDAIWALDRSGTALVRVATLPVAVSDSGAAVIGNTVWLVGGEGPSPLADVIEVKVG